MNTADISIFWTSENDADKDVVMELLEDHLDEIMVHMMGIKEADNVGITSSGLGSERTRKKFENARKEK